MSHYYAKQMFLEQLTKGAKSYRAIRAKIKANYKDVDVKKIRDELEFEGLIELSHTEVRNFGPETKTVFFYQLCEPKSLSFKEVVKSGWDYSGPSTIFTKQEKANMMSTLKMLEVRKDAKLKELVQINAYSKA